MKRQMIHTGLAVGTASAAATQLVIVVVWLLSLVQVAVPDNVASALGVLITIAFGWLIHAKLGPGSANDNGETDAPAAAPAPANDPPQTSDSPTQQPAAKAA